MPSSASGKTSLGGTSTHPTGPRAALRGDGQPGPTTPGVHSLGDGRLLFVDPLTGTRVDITLPRQDRTIEDATRRLLTAVELARQAQRGFDRQGRPLTTTISQREAEQLRRDLETAARHLTRERSPEFRTARGPLRRDLVEDLAREIAQKRAAARTAAWATFLRQTYNLPAPAAAALARLSRLGGPIARVGSRFLGPIGVALTVYDLGQALDRAFPSQPPNSPVPNQTATEQNRLARNSATERADERRYTAAITKAYAAAQTATITAQLAAAEPSDAFRQKRATQAAAAATRASNAVRTFKWTPFPQ